MTNRNVRVSTPRRGRVWTAETVELTLAAAATGVSSQQRSLTILATAMETKMNRSLRGVTLSRMYVTTFWFTEAQVTTPSVTVFHAGVGVFTAGVDAGDYPDLSEHAGDWMYHRTWVLSDRLASTTQPTLLEPQHGSINAASNMDVNSSMRKVGRETEQPHLVVQKASATEEDIKVRFAITALWLVPATWG